MTRRGRPRTHLLPADCRVPRVRAHRHPEGHQLQRRRSPGGDTRHPDQRHPSAPDGGGGGCRRRTTTNDATLICRLLQGRRAGPIPKAAVRPDLDRPRVQPLRPGGEELRSTTTTKTLVRRCLCYGRIDRIRTQCDDCGRLDMRQSHYDSYFQPSLYPHRRHLPHPGHELKDCAGMVVELFAASNNKIKSEITDTWAGGIPFLDAHIMTSGKIKRAGASSSVRAYTIRTCLSFTEATPPRLCTFPPHKDFTTQAFTCEAVD